MSLKNIALNPENDSFSSHDSAEKFREMTYRLHEAGMREKTRKYYEGLNDKAKEYIKTHEEYSWLVKAIYLSC